MVVVFFNHRNYYDYFVNVIIIFSDTIRQGYARYSKISLKSLSQAT